MGAPYYYLVAEEGRRLLNPTSPEKVLELGRVCGLGPESRVLDMGCGKGEPAALLAATYGCRIVEVDFEPTFLAAARARAEELGVAGLCEFHEVVGADFAIEPGAYDAAMCLGASFIFDGLEGTVKALVEAIGPEGYLVVGEPYWRVAEPPAEYLRREGVAADTFADLPGTLERFESWGFELVHFIRADQTEWDSYEAHHWWAVDSWRRAHPAHPQLKEVVRRAAFERESYLRWGAEVLGWAFFVLRFKVGQDQQDHASGRAA